jgi:hypothetical protein
VTRYVMLIGAGPDAGPPRPPEVHQSAVDAHDAFQRHVAEHGRLRSNAALGSADTATTVHAGVLGALAQLDPSDAVALVGPLASRAVGDGPLGATSELVGYYDVELPDLDVAIAAALLLPAACSVEIRPVVTLSGPGVA